MQHYNSKNINKGLTNTFVYGIIILKIKERNRSKQKEKKNMEKMIKLAEAKEIKLTKSNRYGGSYKLEFPDKSSSYRFNLKAVKELINNYK